MSSLLAKLPSYLQRDQRHKKMLPFDELNSADITSLIHGSSLNFKQKNCLSGLLSHRLRLQTPPHWRRATASLATSEEPGILLSLPPDIIMEILYRLHPLDLYHLCMTCTLFRRFLLGMDPGDRENARSTWRKAFNRYPSDIPSPPGGFSVFRWLTFLFGPAICQSCENGGAYLCFGIWKKYCGDCMKQLFVSEDEARSLCRNHHLPANPKDVFKLCHWSHRIAVHFDGVRTFVGEGAANQVEETLRDPVVLREEIEINITISCIQCRSEGGSLDPGYVLGGLVPDIIRMAKNDNEVAVCAQQWVSKLRGEEWDRQVNWYTNRSVKELTKLDYVYSDWKGAKNSIEMCHFVPWKLWGLRRRDFIYHFSSIVPFVDTARAERLVQEKESACTKYYHTLAPSECLHFPYFLFLHWEVVKKDFKKSLYPAELLEWRRSMRNILFQQLLAAPSPILQSIPKTLDLEDDDRVDSPFELAVAVFSCIRCLASHYIGAALVGWDSLSHHMCSGSSVFPHESHSFIEWSVDGHNAAIFLTSSLGLDPKTATAKDMDNADARWFCGHCQIRRNHGICFRKALRWRECLTHSVYCVDKTVHANQNWLLLGEETTRFVKGRERPYPRPDKAIWGCAHCQDSIDLSSTTLYSKVEEHVKDVHNVRKPRGGRDIIPMFHRFSLRFVGRGLYKCRKPVLYQTEPAMKYQCLRCPPIPRDKFWIGDEIFKHLRESHHITELVQGRDWATLDIYHGSVS